MSNLFSICIHGGGSKTATTFTLAASCGLLELESALGVGKREFEH